MRSVESIVTFCDVIGISAQTRVLILKGLLVELVGIEPTTSSLRITASNSAADSISERKWREFMELRSSDAPAC
jgi:hypothetical protein